jgi:hypothetical protein
MDHPKRTFSLAIAVLGWVALACTCSLPKLGGGPAPVATVPVSQEAAKQMQNKLDQAKAQSKSTGQYRVTLTESEITSYAVMQIEQMQSQGENIPILNPQIKFTQGQVWLYATFVADSSTKIPGLVVVSPQVQDGKVVVRVVRVDFGSIPVPNLFLDQLNRQIQSSLDERSSENPDILLTSITIREGEMEVVGKVSH